MVHEAFTDLVKQIQVSESWMTWHDWLELGIITLMVLLILGGGVLTCSLGCNFGNGGLWLLLYAGFIALVIIGANYLLKRVAASKRKMELGLGFWGL